MKTLMSSFGVPLKVNLSWKVALIIAELRPTCVALIASSLDDSICMSGLAIMSLNPASVRGLPEGRTKMKSSVQKAPKSSPVRESFHLRRRGFR